MKRTISIFLCLWLLCCLAIPCMAADGPVITRQPQNPDYPVYSLAQYDVTVHGENLVCSWYLYFQGKEYAISDTSGSAKPWEAYAGETYGPTQSKNGNFTTFTYFFGGIEKELNGSYLYAVISDGRLEVTSAKAYISVTDAEGQPPKTMVATGMEIYQHEVLDLSCEAVSPDGSGLTYLWYETSTGNLKDIVAIDRGAEDKEYLRCDTSQLGTRYYVCAVATESGGSAYTSVIPVTVIARPAEADPPAITTATLPEATAGQDYSAKLECTDPDGVFEISYNPGQANDFEKTDLVLTQHGQLEGTPAKAGTYTFTVCVTGEGGEGYQTFTLTVREGIDEPNIEPSMDPSAEPSTEPSSEPTDPTEETNPGSAPTGESSGQGNAQREPGIPWWATVLIAFAAAGAGIGISVLIQKRKV